MRVLQKSLSIFLLFCAWGITYISCSKLGPPAAPPAPKAPNSFFLFRLENMYQCEGYEDRSFNFYLDNISITRYNQTQYVVNADMCAKIEIGGDWAGSIVVGYLESMDGTQPDEMYREETLTICNDTLVRYKQKIEEMSVYVENLIPRCPIPPGCYKVNGMPFDTMQYTTALKPGYYFVTMLGNMNGEMLWCTTAVFKCEYDDDKEDSDEE